MRIPLIPFFIAMALAVAMDGYIYFAIRRLTKRRLWANLHLCVAILCIATMLILFFTPKKTATEDGFMKLMWTVFTLLSIYIPKVIFTIVDLAASIPRLWRASRPRWLEFVGFTLAGFVFMLIWWGALINRFRIQVNEVEVEIANLPPAFEGYKITQISDLHTGTFASDTSFVSKLADRVNATGADLIVFTGDIVNRKSTELDPFTTPLSRLHAPQGVYSIMGNHDYGDYSSWPSAKAKQADINRLQMMQEQMGWHMLNNSTHWLRINSDSIALIGVENVGDPPFHTYGSLSKAYPETSDSNIKILLSHNPAHWVADISDNTSANIALTLSGHTHAMQIELFGLSPSAFIYPTWGGLYTDSLGRQLYVNIGCGEVGFPARIGATPEITVFTLTGKK